jgi:hypothetical protein
MSDQSTMDFESLRTLLERTAEQPRFRDLRRRRLQRTQVSAVAAVAFGVTLVLMGALLGPRPADGVAPIVPLPSPTSAVTHLPASSLPSIGPSFDNPAWLPPFSPVAVGAEVVALAVHCDPSCYASGGERRLALLSTRDLGRTWQLRGQPDWLTNDALLVGSPDGALWLWAPSSDWVAHSADAGYTWTVGAAGHPAQGGATPRVRRRRPAVGRLGRRPVRV